MPEYVHMHIHAHPDIRKQTFEQAEQFLRAKRVRRLVLLMTYKQQRGEKLSTLKGKELDRFEKRCATIERAFTTIVQKLDALDKHIRQLGAINNGIDNIEREMKDLLDD